MYKKLLCCALFFVSLSIGFSMNVTDASKNLQEDAQPLSNLANQTVTGKPSELETFLKDFNTKQQSVGDKENVKLSIEIEEMDSLPDRKDGRTFKKPTYNQYGCPSGSVDIIAEDNIKDDQTLVSLLLSSDCMKNVVSVTLTPEMAFYGNVTEILLFTSHFELKLKESQSQYISAENFQIILNNLNIFANKFYDHVLYTLRGGYYDQSEVNQKNKDLIIKSLQNKVVTGTLDQITLALNKFKTSKNINNDFKDIFLSVKITGLGKRENQWTLKSFLEETEQNNVKFIELSYKNLLNLPNSQSTLRHLESNNIVSKIVP